ncbi:MAG: carboxypeptidase regulatory-like domain-containing protein [Bryobacterales bacterium]|nr:carboxypeptidase regulatory-like domain-containing protein [Bryobacterales bacterium]MBV9397611.1 carboxypeptidase regulatory-like domain-containing protein [Bryobacterales bacterium]
MRISPRYILALTLAAMFSPAIHAQLVLGNITGTVTDPQNSVVPNVKVEIKNLDTNLLVTAATQPDGSYQIANLPIGTYSVTFSHEGFSTEVFSEILVQANRTTTVDAQMKVGQVATTVEVTGTPLRNEVDATVGYVLDSLTIQNTPLGTGSFTQLAILSPGVSADFLPGSGTNAGLGNQNIWANGQRDTSNSFSMNGVSTNNLFNGKSSSQVTENRFILNTGQFVLNHTGNEAQTATTVYNAIGQGLPTPPPETIEELRVNTSQYDASQGGTSGAQIALITKTGTNQLHGQSYYYVQNNAFNAAQFFRNADPSIPASGKVPALHFNKYGVALGGPIKHDKVFFFVSYQGLIDHDALSSQATDTVPQHLTDDRSPQALAAVANQDFASTIGGNPVTPAQIDPVALKLMQAKVNGQYVIPSATVTDPNVAKQLGYNALVNGVPSVFRADMANGNLDWNPNDKDRLSGKFFISKNPNKSPFAQSNVIGFPQSLDAESWVVSLNNTYVVRPNLTWEQRIGVVRQGAAAVTSQALTPQDIGMNLFGGTNFPAFEIRTADGTLTNSLFVGPRNGSNFSNNAADQNRGDVSTNLNWVAGRHTVYFGFSFNRTQLNIINGATDVAGVATNDFPGFLRGTLYTPFSYLYNGAANRYLRANTAGAYATDTWKIKSNLTITAGVRYDFNGPFSEKYGNLSSFHPDAYQYNASTDTYISSGVVVAGNNPTLGTKGVSDSTLTDRQWGIGPRVGIAWSPRFVKNLTMRAGAGIYYDRGEYFSYLSPGSGPNGTGGPFGITLAAPFVTKVSATSSGTLENPFGSVPPPPPNNPNAVTALLPNLAQIKNGANTYVFGGYDPSNTLPYTENWSFDVQWQPANSWLISTGYVGNHGVHQVLPIPFNQPLIATASNAINGETTSYGFNAVASESLKTFGGGNASIRVPYLGFDTQSVFYKTIGISTYNALQVGLRKRLSSGLQITASYTWSHSLDEQSGLGLFFNGNDPTYPHLSYGNSAYDRTHVFITSYLYELPSPGKKGSWTAAAVNGWQLAGMITAQSGQPFNMYDFSGAVSGVYNGSFPNVSDPIIGFQQGVTPSMAMLQGTMGVNPAKPYIDVSKLYIPVIAPGTSGVPAGDTVETGWANSGRDVFRGPFQSRWDQSIAKTWRITERFGLRYSAEFYNVLNHPSFDVPNNSVSLYSVSSGKVTVRAPSSTAGYISRTIGSPRFIQMSLRLTF